LRRLRTVNQQAVPDRNQSLEIFDAVHFRNALLERGLLVEIFKFNKREASVEQATANGVFGHAQRIRECSRGSSENIPHGAFTPFSFPQDLPMAFWCDGRASVSCSQNCVTERLRTSTAWSTMLSKHVSKLAAC
jgi:hypothetical protein